MDDLWRVFNQFEQQKHRLIKILFAAVRRDFD